MDITQAVRDYHMAQQDKENRQPGIWDLYLISRASVAIIAYQKRAIALNDNSDFIRDDLASQYQFISGVFMICRDMLNNASPMIKENIAISAEDLYNYADKHGIFLSDNGMACAGSTAKIIEFLELCNGGVIDRPIDSNAILEQLVGDIPLWYCYAIATVELDCYLESEVQRRRAEQRLEDSIIERSSSEYYENIALYCSKILHKVSPEKNADFQAAVDFEQGALERQNKILQTLGRTALSTLKQEHLGTRLAR